MKNRITGTIIVAIGFLIGFIIYAFNRALTGIVGSVCSHGSSCPMWGTISFQTNVSIGVMVLVIAVGVYLIFFGQEEKIVTKVRRMNHQVEPRKLSKNNFKKVMADLNRDERLVFEKIIQAEGTIFQAELLEQTGFNKVKVTRILDKLEGRDVVQRRRRGMSNVVILKR